MPSIRKYKQAFTLIELLVVIAIIAILAAILFPVFAQAKLAAKKAASVSNVKQLTLGNIMYTNDYDDLFGDSEWGAGNATNNPIYTNWATSIYPYVKSGTNHPEKGIAEECNGGDGVFLDPAAPPVSETDTGVAAAFPNTPNPTYQWGFSYGVNENIMVHNDYSYNPTFLSSGQQDTSLASTQIPSPADSILLMTKGVQNTSVNSGDDDAAWTYPYFVTAQREYIGSITTDPTNPGAGTVTRDGDESASTPGGVTLADGFIGNSLYDTDCASATCHLAWEDVGHPRYRYSGTGVAGFTDGHVKAIHKGALQWYKNIFVSNPGIVKDGYGSWCSLGDACSWGGADYAIEPY
jgi:prepilin-type N-terminal cleavage/methylation domain-containing protein